MRQIKPQAALLQTKPTQIGQCALLGVAAGVGFRLSDPRILVHEATVWEALKVAPSSAPLPAPTLRKRHAEWLMLGHSLHDCPDAMPGQRVSWTCSIRLAESRKILSCAAKLVAGPRGWRASLATDHRLAARGQGGENPVGTTARVPALQLLGAAGISEAPDAGTGPIGTEWPCRQRWMPDRPGRIEVMAGDGTHMGFPAAMDSRYFQSAPSNQWAGQAAWASGSAYELLGLGPDGQGFSGRLPNLVPRLLCTRRSGPAAIELSSELQTVWFLPDHDIGVLWWTAELGCEYFDDDQVDECLLAFHEEGADVPTDRLRAFGDRRKDLLDNDPALHADTVLMPDIERGWTWEVIVGSADHPRFGLLPRPYRETCARLSAHLASLAEASQRVGDAQARQERLAEAERAMAGVPATPPGTTDWRERLREGDLAGLDDALICDADLSGLVLRGWQAKALRFERCRLDASEWVGCRLEGSAFVDCDFRGSRFESNFWQGAYFKACQFTDTVWCSDHAENSMFDNCRLDRFRITSGQWRQSTWIDCRGDGGLLQDLQLDGMSLSTTRLSNWHWSGLVGDGLGLVRCDLDGLRIDRCVLEKCSVVQSALRSCRWNRCTTRTTVFGDQSSIEKGRFEDCLFDACSWNGLGARGIVVSNCNFASFVAQRLDAVGSSWRASVLDGTNAAYADFAGASFERCSLGQTSFHGANLIDTHMQACNLVGATTGWALTSPRPAWSDNLDINHQTLPRRHA